MFPKKLDIRIVKREEELSWSTQCQTIKRLPNDDVSTQSEANDAHLSHSSNCDNVNNFFIREKKVQHSNNFPNKMPFFTENSNSQNVHARNSHNVTLPSLEFSFKGFTYRNTF